MKIVSIVGARPQFIKCAAVSRQLRKTATEVLVHTGQHYDQKMSDVFFAELGIPQPDYRLGVGSGTHARQTGAMLIGIEEVLVEERPDWVLVYGDTNSTLAGALAAVKLHMPVAHVEAGLRSFNRKMPEEVNRVLTDHASTLLLAPTQTAVDNLQREGVAEESIHLVGDVMYDAVLHFRQIAEQRSRILQQLGLGPKQYLLATFHRAENTEDRQRLLTIRDALVRIADGGMPVVLPLHPRTKHALERHGIPLPATPELMIIEPVGYLDMVMLEAGASVVLTDSGGVQKEAYFCRTPCVTLRDETEWQELIALGWNRLAPPIHLRAVLAAVQQALHSLPETGGEACPYGSGDAARQIAQRLAGRPRWSAGPPIACELPLAWHEKARV